MTISSVLDSTHSTLSTCERRLCQSGSGFARRAVYRTCGDAARRPHQASRRQQRLGGAGGQGSIDRADRRRAKLLQHCQARRRRFNRFACRARDCVCAVLPAGWIHAVAIRDSHSVAEQLGATPMGVALAWLLQRSPNILLIPGTSSVAHLRENVAAAALTLPADALGELNRMETPVNSSFGSPAPSAAAWRSPLRVRSATLCPKS